MEPDESVPWYESVGPARPRDMPPPVGPSPWVTGSGAPTTPAPVAVPAGPTAHGYGPPPTTPAPSLGGGPRPVTGWSLLLVFAVLLVLSVVTPFASVGGQSQALVAEPLDALPVMVLAAVAVGAALAGRAGYDVGIAMGAGVVLVYSVLTAMFAGLLRYLLELSEAMGQTFHPHVGMVTALGAVVVGVLVAIPSVATVLRSRTSPRVPWWLAVLSMAGTVTYMVVLLWPQPGRPFWTGDPFTDAVAVVWMAAIALPAIAVLVLRTAAAAALLFGVLLLPATAWVVSRTTWTISRAAATPAPWRPVTSSTCRPRPGTRSRRWR